MHWHVEIDSDKYKTSKYKLLVWAIAKRGMYESQVACFFFVLHIHELESGCVNSRNQKIKRPHLGA